MAPRRAGPLALAACLAAAAAILACGPGDPPAPAPGPAPGDGGGGEPDGGSGGSPGGGAGDGSSGVATAWAVALGRGGDEWVQDVAAAPGGSVVALTAIGPGDGRLEEIGLVQLGPGGSEEWARTYRVDAPVRFPPGGALSTGPAGEVYVAIFAACGTGCRGLGSALDGSALVQISAEGDVRWIAALPGDVVSQPVVDPEGNVAVASAAAGATLVQSFRASGAARWTRRLAGAASDVALAADGGGNVIVGRGSDVAKLDPGGEVAWSRSVGAAVAAVAGTSSGAVIVAASTAGGPAVLVLEPGGGDRAVRPLRGPGDGLLVEVGTGRRVGAVTGAGGCAATLSALEVDGPDLWSRPLAEAECDGSDLTVHAVTVTTSGAVVAGGALRGPVDLGRGPLRPRGTDGFLAAFGP